jgi:hypothetical protein
MTMQHRAFLFDFVGFQSELAGILEAALQSGSAAALIRFVDERRSSLRDPYEGEPLPDDWQHLVDSMDPQQVGDVALTRYYNPQDDRGLGPAWEAAADSVERIATSLGYSPVLGRTIGPPGRHFDPGKMGAYVLSPADVENALDAIASSAIPTGRVDSLVQLLTDAKTQSLGVFVTF